MEQVIAQKRLTGETKYDFCPTCLADCEKYGKDKSGLQPLFYVTTLEELDKTDNNGQPYKKKIFDNFYRCSKCNAKYTVDDFRILYTCRADKTKWTEPPKEKNYYGE